MTFQDLNILIHALSIGEQRFRELADEHRRTAMMQNRQDMADWWMAESDGYVIRADTTKRVIDEMQAQLMAKAVR